MTLRRSAATLLVATLALGACKRSGEIDTSQGVGISAVRSACPVAGVPAGTGDITLFDPPASRDARAIDVVATLTNVRANCVEGADTITSTLTFDVQARRTNATEARSVTLPYFITVVRGGTQVVSKRVAQVTLNFAPGAVRAQAQGQGTAIVDRAAATLPQETRDQINRRRRPGDQDAAVDPLSDPAVRQAVLAATFEAMVGFQLTDEQLRYNVTR
ncbi:hypothetical protein [Sphingomonas sp. VNH70]|uniref:hypothetical protein n=1 Tax=Sphingomonas silueang TaxID=3156617 RepID=UPI0032B59BC0